MKILSYKNPHSFLKASEGILLADEALNSLMIGITMRLQKDPSAYENPYFTCGIIDGIVTTPALMTPPHPLILAGKADPKILSAIAEDLLDKDRKVNGVVASRALSDSFSTIWKKRTGCSIVTSMEQGVFQLTHLNTINISPGSLRVAEEKDRELLNRWGKNFQIDIYGEEKGAGLEAKKIVDKGLREKRIHLWTIDGNLGDLIHKDGNNGMFRFESIPTNNECCVPFVVHKRRERNKLTKDDIPFGLKPFFCLLRCSSLTYRYGYAALLAP